MDTIGQPIDLIPEPDLHPLYPWPSDVSRLLSTNFGLTPQQKATLVSHCMSRAAVFADLSFLQYIIHDSQAQPFIDLNLQDEDGLVLASIIITGFGADSDRDVEREECVRLLVTEGADMNIADKAGWTPLHHAALLAPPTLISHLLTHGCSPLSQTHSSMTALDLITAYSPIPGREDVALFLEEAMRGEGWQSSKMANQRRDVQEKSKLQDKKRHEQDAIDKLLNLNKQWWDREDVFPPPEDLANGMEHDDNVYTPPFDYSSVLVFSPGMLPGIYDSLIHDFRPSARNADPANVLYMLARFACLACDHTWLEELIIGATDAIEDAAFNHTEDLTYLIFWLYNCTAWLHFMRCDEKISEACGFLGSFDLIEEVVNTVYALLIRVGERRIDRLIDSALLDHTPLASELESVQFESEWSLFRSPFSSKRKLAPANVTPSSTSTSVKSSSAHSPLPSSRPNSPTPFQGSLMPSTPKGLSSLRQSISRARGSVSISSLQSLIADGSESPNAIGELTAFLSALHLLLTESGINPVIITQIWSQVMYWTSCEVFNRILTRKRYLCRSRALQIAMNLGVIEEWIGDVGLPRGVGSHFASARELLLWLQCLSSMDDFSNLIATIQTFKRLNPLQMRRAMRDYKYEVNEPRMADDCSQYLLQLQKDWERERVKMGVEALRREINGREQDSDDSGSSGSYGFSGSSSRDPSILSSTTESNGGKYNIDILLDKTQSTSAWLPQQPPEVLGELLESRFMLSLQLPSDPKLLAAIPGKRTAVRTPNPNRSSLQLVASEDGRRSMSRSRSSNNSDGLLSWVSAPKRLRGVNVDILERLDGFSGSRRWVYGASVDELEEGTNHGGNADSSCSGESVSGGDDDTISRRVPLTRLSRAAPSRSRTARDSIG